jgi:ribosomal protein S18 acetylase RimI-like enzyme
MADRGRGRIEARQDGVVSDRDLVMRWVHAWAHLRGFRVEQVDGWPLVHVRAPSRDTEIVCVEPGRPAFQSLAASAARDPRAMLTVFGRDLDPYRRASLPLGIRIDRDDEVFMTTTLLPSPGPLPAGFTPRWIVDGTRATYCVDEAGRLAAEGTVGVLGTDAVFDAVETSPAHRRRGLGRQVMSTLTTWACGHGASTGLLAASADGVRLYTALGWDSTLAMWSLMGVQDD